MTCWFFSNLAGLRSQSLPRESHKPRFLHPAKSSSITAITVGLLLLAGCSGSKFGDTLGRSLEADPQLTEGAGALSGQSPSPQPQASPTATPSPSSAASPKPSPSPEKTPQADSEQPKVVAGGYSDLAKAPEEIQPYLVDLLELNLLKVRPPAASGSSGSASGSASGSSSAAPPSAPPNPDEFRPNQAITRREYARWLLATNNRFYEGQRNRKIRPGVTSSQPVFQDVKANDPDFAAIQGLAEAGIIPSPLTGSSTTVTFRPDAPLTRKDLLLWKVPLDTRQPLPQATPTAVQEVWGFQDASKIEARALQAVLADYQNGDFANIRRAFGYTTLFQPDKAATRAEAAAVLWRFGNASEGISAQELRNGGGNTPPGDSTTNNPRSPSPGSASPNSSPGET